MTKVTSDGGVHAARRKLFVEIQTRRRCRGATLGVQKTRFVVFSFKQLVGFTRTRRVEKGNVLRDFQVNVNRRTPANTRGIRVETCKRHTKVFSLASNAFVFCTRTDFTNKRQIAANLRAEPNAFWDVTAKLEVCRRHEAEALKGKFPKTTLYRNVRKFLVTGVRFF